MTVLFVSSPYCKQHEMGSGHPESPARLDVLNRVVSDNDWGERLFFADAPLLDINALQSVHPSHHVDAILERQPTEGLVYLDADTAINPCSIDAALHAAGAGVFATDKVLGGEVKSAFCSVRPPGHHAESVIAMGFCVFNSIALAVEHALAQGLSRVAVLDFDVHHGNGTVEIFQNRPEVLVCSSFQYPFYPGRFDDVDSPNICLTPLAANTGSDVFRREVECDWVSAISNHQPEMLFISAGFDAHVEDPLGGLALLDDDYLWITQLLVELADRYSGGRIVSLLEGGYNLDALARSVNMHLRGLVSM